MVHRDARAALVEEREAVLSRLAALEVVDAEDERAALLRRLDAVRRSLEQASPVARSPLLRSLRIVQACPASWASMEGDHRVRHCSQCDRNVYDLTALMPEEVEAFLGTQRESSCVRMYARPDGHYQDGPCVPGERRMLRRAATLAASLGLGGLVALLSAGDSSVDHAVRAALPAREVRFDAEAFLNGPPERPVVPLDPVVMGVMMGAPAIDPESVLAQLNRPDTRGHPRGLAVASIEGGPMREPLERMYGTRRGAIVRCYEVHLRRDPELAGEVELAVTVASSGGVHATTSTHEGPLADVAACAVRVTNGMRLTPAEADELRVRIAFRPDGL